MSNRLPCSGDISLWLEQPSQPHPPLCFYRTVSQSLELRQSSSKIVDILADCRSAGHLEFAPMSRDSTPVEVGHESAQLVGLL